MKVGVVSLGCVKNRVDTEQALALLLAEGYEQTADASEAEVILVNTCGFIQPAKEESIEAILDMARMKREGKCRVLCVTGCLAQRYEKELMSEIPEIDCLLGVGQYRRLPDMLREALGGGRPHDVRRIRDFLLSTTSASAPPTARFRARRDGPAAAGRHGDQRRSLRPRLRVSRRARGLNRQAARFLCRNVVFHLTFLH